MAGAVLEHTPSLSQKDDDDDDEDGNNNNNDDDGDDDDDEDEDKDKDKGKKKMASEDWMGGAATILVARAASLLGLPTREEQEQQEQQGGLGGGGASPGQRGLYGPVGDVLQGLGLPYLLDARYLPEHPRPGEVCNRRHDNVAVAVCRRLDGPHATFSSIRPRRSVPKCLMAVKYPASAFPTWIWT